MYNIPFSRMRTLTLACALLIFGGSLNLLYADNDPCYKNPKCLGPAKRIRRRAQRPSSPVSQPRPTVAKRALPIRKQRREAISTLVQSDTSSLVDSVLPSGTSLKLGVADTDQSQRWGLGPISQLHTANTSNTVAPASGNSLEATLQHAYDLITVRKHKEAMKLFEAISRTSPTEARAYEGMGDVHMAKGRHSKAIVAYRKAQSLEPQNTSLSNKLKEAIAIEKEQDKINRDKWLSALIQAGAGAALGATQRHNELKQQQQFRFRVSPHLPRPMPSINGQ